METITTYMIHWFGPFTCIEDVTKWEKENSDRKCNLYILEGQKKYARFNRHYYCGQTTQGVYKRLNNIGHHIEEFRCVEEIWLGCFRNVDAKKADINIVEKLTTAYLSDEVGTQKMLNEINMSFPKSQICVINRWFKPEKLLWSRFKEYSPSRIISEVILHYYNDNLHMIYGTDKLKCLKKIED